MIAIINYNAGNIKSVSNAVHRLGYDYIVTDNIETLNQSEKIIFPGVGEAGSAMNYLREKKLDAAIKKFDQPVLGICLGLQLMCNNSAENNTDCLGIFDVNVLKFPVTLPVPHMGWNNLDELQGDLARNISADDNFYFVHSYYAEICENTTATCNYILPFSATLQKNNFYATQFHPEKSASAGEKILKNFLEL